VVTAALLAMLGALVAGVATARVGPVLVLSIDSIAYVAGAIALHLLRAGRAKGTAT
jgi:hypothetical protein